MALAALVMGGCVTTTPIYQWGGYESKLYAGYKDQTKMEELRVGLETHIAAMNASGQKVAPGLYAELGTLYLQSGDSVKARECTPVNVMHGRKAKGLMGAMIQNLERQESARAETIK